MFSFIGLLTIWVVLCMAQPQPNSTCCNSDTPRFRTDIYKEYLRSIALGEEEFSLDLLQRISAEVDRANVDFMISPFSVWLVLILLYEGADGHTYEQMHRVLRIKVDDESLRVAFQGWNSLLNSKSSSIEVASLQSVYIANSFSLNRNYRETVQWYNVQPHQVDFFSRDTVTKINQDIYRGTHGLIPNLVQPQDIYGARLFLLSTLFFKGQWKLPFEESNTRLKPFYNENGEEITQIPMMSQTGDFATLSHVPGLDGYVLELKYGELDEVSMIVILPKEGVKLTALAQNLNNMGLATILQRLSESKEKSVEVEMPKFTTTTDFNLKEVLVQMGITDIFNESLSNLDRMARGLFANLFLHSTKIIVNEQGTIAAAATAVELENKMLNPHFELNRPFQYLIVEKSSQLLLFAGQVRNPKET